MKITVKEIKHIERLLKESGCPTIDCTPYAMQIIRDVKIKGENVFEVQLSN